MLVKVTPVPETKLTAGWRVATGVVLNVESAFVTVLANCVSNVVKAWPNVASTLLIAVFSPLTACVNALLKVCVLVMPIPVVADVVVAPVVVDVEVALLELLAVLI